MNDKSVQLEQVLAENTGCVQYVRRTITAGHAQIIVNVCAKDMCSGISHQMCIFLAQNIVLMGARIGQRRSQL